MALKKIHFSVSIDAPREKVWEVLWDDATYRKWTSAFSEGSYAESDWNEGSKILFLSVEGGGMYSIIEKKSAPEHMSFKHLGVVREGKELSSDEDSKAWSGAMESYTLEEKNGFTNVMVAIDVVKEHEDYFNDSFPKALQIVKELAEKKHAYGRARV